MRSAFLLRLILALGVCAAAARAQVNPHTQIRWPVNCTGDHMAYNWQANVCVHVGPVGNTGEVQVNQGGAWYSLPGFNYNFVTNTLTTPNISVPGASSITIPPASVTWPGSCTSGVYSPASNTCVAPGTAANPAGPSGSGQMNAGGVFGPVPGLMADPTNGWITAGGLTYAKGNQSGAGGNGIVNAVGYGKTVLADPSYVITTTANMTLGSATITVANPTGIINGMWVSGNVSSQCTVLAGGGTATLTLGCKAQSTNPSAIVSFFEEPYRYNYQAVGGLMPPASSFMYTDNRLGWSANIRRDPGISPITGRTDFNFNYCMSTKHQNWSATGGPNGGSGTNQYCSNNVSWFAAPSTNYGTVASNVSGIWPGNWGVTVGMGVSDYIAQTGIGELFGGMHGKSGIGDGPVGYWYYADYLGSVAGADEGQGGIFIGGGEATTTTTGTVSTGGGGLGTQSLSYTCLTDCQITSGVSSAGPGDGRYWVDKTGQIAVNVTAKTLAQAFFIPGTVTIDTSVPVSTFWGTIGWGITGNTVSGSSTVSALSSTTGYSTGMPITGVNIPVGATIVSINTGASSLVMSANATATANGSAIGIGDVITPPPPPNANGVPFSSGTTPMTFTVNAGTINTAYAMTSVANASGGTTVYSGAGLAPVAGGSQGAGYANLCLTPGTTTVTITGFTNAANNGTFTCVSSTYFTITLNNASGVSETHAGTLTMSFTSPGPPAVGDLVCFNYPSHEQAKITAVSGTGPWSITVPLRMPHNSTSWMFSNGTCGSFLNLTANDVQPASGIPAITLHYPFDVIGSLAANTLAWAWHSTYGINSGIAASFPNGNMYFPEQMGVGSTLQNLGGVVAISSQVLNQREELFYQPNLYISGVTQDPAYNGLCTNSTVDFSTGSQRLLCTQTSSIGHAAVTLNTTAAIAVGTTGYGNTGAFIWKGAEGLDILDYSEANCAAATAGQHAPCYDGKNITLEPNNAAWANGDQIEEPHHYSSQIKASKEALWDFDPYQQGASDGWYRSIYGPGACCGYVGNPSGNRSIMFINNANLNNMYMGHGGTVFPPGGIAIGGGGTASMGFSYGIDLQNAPEPNNLGTALYIGCPSNPFGCTDSSYSYKIITANANTAVASTNVLSYVPAFGEITIGSSGNPLVIGGEVNAVTLRDNVYFKALVAPTLTLTAQTSGGSLADGTYCYLIVPRVGSIFGAYPTETCKAISGGGGNGAMKLVWTRSNSATIYYVCGRTTGAELQLTTLNGADSVIYTDYGGVTPATSCNFGTTTQNGGVDQAGQVGINSLGTAFQVVHKAPAGMTVSTTITDPPVSGTTGLGLTLPTGTPTFTQGANVTSCTCAASYTCNNTRGRLTIVGGTATTGTICTVTWSASLTTAPFFTLGEMGASTLHGIDHGVPSATSVTITAAVSVSGATLSVDYETQP